MQKNLKGELSPNSNESFCVSIYTPQKENKKNKTVMKRSHFHTHYEIINIQSSAKNDTFQINNRSYPINTNTFCLVTPYTKHMSCRSNTGRRLLITIKENFLLPTFEFLNIDIVNFFNSPVIMVSDKQRNSILQIAKKITVESDYVESKLLIAQIIHILNNHIATVSPLPQDNDYTTLQLIEYISANYYLPINLDTIANEFSMNKFTLCKKFKLDTGRTILDLLTQIRLNHARDMLETTNLLITQVAADSGFNSVTYFSTIFKQTFNCTPLEYRNKFKKELYE